LLLKESKIEKTMDKFKVLVTSLSFGKTSKKPEDLLKRNNCELVYKRGPFSDEELARMIRGYFSIIAGEDEVGLQTLTVADQLKVVAKHGIGTDKINIQKATKRGIIVTRALGSNEEAVADFVFTLILGISRKLVEASISAKKGLWEGTKYTGIKIYQKVLGIVGLGGIGKKVAKRALGFDMEVLYYDILRKEDFERNHPIRFVDLETLLQSSDFVTVHVPLTPSTQNLITYRELRKMKRTAYLINTARGDIVNEDDLYRALKEELLAGAAIDVYSKEPPGKDFLLFTLSNVLSTPHISGYTTETSERTGMIVAEEIIRMAKGESPKFSVNWAEILSSRND